MLSDEPETLRAFENVQIPLWRANRLKTLADNVVIVRGRHGTYIRGAVISIDYDLSMLERIIEAFYSTVFVDVEPPEIATPPNP